VSNPISASATLHVQEALSFLREELLDPLARQRVIAAQFKLDGNAQISAKQWEIFAAVLLGRDGSSAPGSTDLVGVEVKSAKVGGSFEYQYHRRIGAAKLAGDAHAAHLFISYAKDYGEIEVRLLRSKQVHDTILGWKPRLEAAYASSVSHERCRVTLPYAMVRDQGQIILSFRDGAVTSSSPGAVADLVDVPSCGPTCCAA
jgi:hypothetical protein